MDFDQWLNEMSNVALPLTDQETTNSFDEIDDQIYWNLEDEEELENFK